MGHRPKKFAQVPSLPLKEYSALATKGNIVEIRQDLEDARNRLAGAIMTTKQLIAEFTKMHLQTLELGIQTSARMDRLDARMDRLESDVRIIKDAVLNGAPPRVDQPPREV